MRLLVFVFFQAISIMSFAESNQFNVEQYVEASMEGLRVQTEAHSETWGLHKAESWNVDQETGVIYWSFSDGKVARAHVQIIGTYNPKDSTFLWAWDHPSIMEPLQSHAKLVREFGLKHKVDLFTERKVIVDEDKAWEFIAVANRLAEANGGYRGEAGGPLVFMTFGEVELKQSKP